MATQVTIQELRDELYSTSIRGNYVIRPYYNGRECKSENIHELEEVYWLSNGFDPDSWALVRGRWNVLLFKFAWFRLDPTAYAISCMLHDLGISRHTALHANWTCTCKT